MLKKALFLGLFAGLLVVGLSGTVFAANVGSEAGAEIVASQQAMNAAQNHVYDLDKLALIGTRAGADVFDFNAPQTKADIAASRHNYDLEKLRLIGTEGGLESHPVLTCPC